MKIELIKDEKLNGLTFWNICVDGSTEESFLNEEQAKGALCRYVERFNAGYPKKTIINTFTFE